MEPLEIEVKFHLLDRNSIRDRLLDIGAETTGRVFETNLRFEDDNKTLLQKKSLLRLRWDTKTTLTFKSEPSTQDRQFKIFKELEVEVSDFSTMSRILESLGFHKEQTYEKWREIFILNDTHFCIDTMPFGDFLEIEGEKADIKNYASAMGQKWKKRILFNYLAIFDILKEKLDLPFSDVTFNNFKNVRFDLNKYTHLFEAGRE